VLELPATTGAKNLLTPQALLPSPSLRPQAILDCETDEIGEAGCGMETPDGGGGGFKYGTCGGEGEDTRAMELELERLCACEHKNLTS
jgi:hypothetical protein